MKRILLTILPVFLTLALIGQNNELSRTGGGPVETGPVIINISGYNVHTYSVDKTYNFDVVEVKNTQTRYLDKDGIQHSGNANAYASGQDGGNRTAGELNPQELSANKIDDPQQRVVEEVKTNLKVYPIPAATNLKVELGQEVTAEISMMNIIGQKVFTKKGKLSNLTISVNDYTSGTYFLMINIGEEMIAKRVQIR